MVTRPDADGVALKEAKALLKAKTERLRAERERRAAHPVAEHPPATQRRRSRTGSRGWRCHGATVCGDLLHPSENHKCSGFVPKYVEHDEAWHERQEFRREEMRASKTKAVPVCDECGEEMPTLLDGQYDEEYCVTDETRAARHHQPPCACLRTHNAINDHEDDLSGYEDEPEEDYCEGDDDGYDCD